ncbi:MAG: glycine cleavage T C-terminal barrel domain-containing protein [Gemmatimonadaceae bacterium]
MSITPIGMRLDPALGAVAGRSVVMHYGDPLGEIGALRAGCIVVDRSARGRTWFDGAQAVDVLTGLVTNDVAALAVGAGQYAAALTPKGKVIADVRILRMTEQRLLVDCGPRAHDAWAAMVKKYVNPRLAAVADVTSATRDVGVFGVTARRVASTLTGLEYDALGALAPYAQMEAVIGDATVHVVRVPDLELDGYELIAPDESFDDVWRRAVSAGATPAGLEAFEIARIEAGRPEWGLDIDEATLAQEANLEELHAISYTKGCYTGQEVVARVHFRGHVNKHLRGLLCGDCAPAPARALLYDDAGKQVGDVRSSAISPRLGAVALGMVRREVPAGTTLTVRWDGGESRSDVTQLPFPA